MRKTERKLKIEKTGRAKQAEKIKTPSILKFFPKLSHEKKKETVNLEGNTNSVGRKVLGSGGVVGNGMDNANQRDIGAQAMGVSQKNTDCGANQFFTKNNTEQQRLVVQQKIIGRDTELCDTGCVGQPVTGLERDNECTEQLSAE